MPKTLVGIGLVLLGSLLQQVPALHAAGDVFLEVGKWTITVGLGHKVVKVAKGTDPLRTEKKLARTVTRRVRR